MTVRLPTPPRSPSPAPEAAGAAPPRVWGFMYALGRDGPPDRVTVGGRPMRLKRHVKHDFWAATSFFVDETTGEPAVLKFGRSQPLLGLPMRWAGRFLTRRESWFYQRLADVPSVPAWLGLIEDGWIGFAHAFAAGTPMSEVDAGRLDAKFFAELERALHQLHERDIAYVDLNKPQNVIVGEGDNRPYLIDFQISFDARRWLLPAALRAMVLRQAMRADRYHLLKHKKRRRPDLLTPQEREEVGRRAWFIRLHRSLARPYFFVRRRLLERLRRSGRLLPEGSK